MTTYHCTLAKKYDPEKHDVLGWMASEKIDGVRALWCPERKGFFSRSNKPLNVPDRWRAMFSTVKIRLDGEFFMGRGRFQDTVSAVRKKTPTDEEFEGVQYVVFDAIVEGRHTDRLAAATAALIDAGLAINGTGIVFVLKHYMVKDMGGARAMYKWILEKGGEGLMLRNPLVEYEFKRSSDLLKWKDEIDGVALVTGYDPGQGKHEGRAGALVCKCKETGVVFRVGTGLSDAEREWWQELWDSDWNIPPFRTIRWRAMERTRDNIPRHPAYAGIYKGE